MYVTIRRYAGSAHNRPEAIRKAEAGLLPKLRQEPGFQDYYGMADGKGDIVTVSVFRDAATANAANARVRDWVQANLRDLLPNPPEVISGDTLMHALAMVNTAPGQ